MSSYEFICKEFIKEKNSVLKLTFLQYEILKLLHFPIMSFILCAL